MVQKKEVPEKWDKRKDGGTETPQKVSRKLLHFRTWGLTATTCREMINRQAGNMY